jgi:hypothetical protein
LSVAVVSRVLSSLFQADGDGLGLYVGGGGGFEGHVLANRFVSGGLDVKCVVAGYAEKRVSPRRGLHRLDCAERAFQAQVSFALQAAGFARDLDDQEGNLTLRFG